MASTAMAPARPRPNSLMTRWPPSRKAPKTSTMMAAAAVIVRPVASSPAVTASLLSSLRSHSSWMREMRNTS